MKTYKRNTLIKELQYLAEYLGRTPKCQELDDLMPSLNTFIRYFGSWNLALKAAGLTLAYHTNIVRSKEELLELLVVYSKVLGRTPTKREVQNNKEMPSTTTYTKHFGSYGQACEKADLLVNTRAAHIKKESLALSYNKEWLQKENKTKTIREINKDLGFKSLDNLNKRFKELGIKPNYSLTSSLKEKEWLDSLGITERQYPIANYKVDGYDPETNTVYEFLGDYWHGNPEVYDPDEYNKSCSKTFGQLFDETNIRLEHIKSLGYNIITKWENDILQLEESVKIK